jgi:hypothetical protein
VLAWKLCGKGKVVKGVIRLLSCVGLGDDVSVGVYQERRGGRNSKYKANKSMT